MSMRIGQGIDAHRFGEGDHVVIGGAEIPFNQGLVAHSDGDVLIHALCDALLGAAGLGDIGKHFPDTDAAWKDANSRYLLRHVVKSVAEAGWAPVNVDATIIAQAPKMAPHILQMVANLSVDLELAKEAVNIKATTTEGMGFTGREEGIAATAVVLLAAS